MTDVPETLRELPDLIPVRKLNEFCYCPRLGYLEWVHGEFAQNLETREGTFGHRRVDREDRRALPAPEEDAETDPIHARSLLLASQTEGLIAKIDMVEIDGPLATPVDYKRGRVPKIPEMAWEPERVQLCAQGLILRDHGYACDEGILYFIESKRRITVAFDEELVARVRELANEFRTVARNQRIPNPLVDSPKCPRCSLVGICLPDETNLLRDQADRSDSQPRRLLPTQEDALPVYVDEQGARVGKTGERLTVTSREGKDQSVRLIDVSQVSLFGNAQISSQVTRELVTRGTPVCHFSYGGYFVAMTAGLIHNNVDLRIRQFRAASDERSLGFARQFVSGKIRNCRTLLRRNLPDKGRIIPQLADFARRATLAKSIETLLGIEGAAARGYFEHFARLLKFPDSFAFRERNRRPPKDPVNALLSFMYALLLKDVVVAVQTVGFDPMLGFYHKPRFGRPSLALDLMEEFRPLIVDSTVLSLVNTREVTEEHFVARAGAVAITSAGRRATLAAYERRMSSLVTHPVFGYRISYRRTLEVQARLLARVLLGEISEYPYFHTR